MTGPTHVVVGLAATVLCARVTGLIPSAIGLLMVFVGSLAPDIDDEGSITRPGKILNRFLPKGIAQLLDDLAQLLRNLLRLFTRHRGFTHWPLVALVIIAAGLVFRKLWIFWFGWGYLSHILADYCTKQGVPVLAPFDMSYHSSPLTVRTGSLVEAVLCFVLICLVWYWGFEFLPEQTQEGLRQIWLKLN